MVELEVQRLELSSGLFWQDFPRSSSDQTGFKSGLTDGLDFVERLKNSGVMLNPFACYKCGI